MQNSCIIDWELHQKVMAKKKIITVCTGIGANMFFPEYITIELDLKESNTIISDWLEEHGDPEIDKFVEEYIENMTNKSKK